MPFFDALIEGSLSFRNDQPVIVEANPVRFQSRAGRMFSNGISFSLEDTLCLVEWDKDTDALAPRQVLASHVTAEKTRIGDSSVTSNAWAVFAPPQSASVREHVCKQIGPRSRERQCRCCEGLVCGCYSEFGQEQHTLGHLEKFLPSFLIG